MPRVFVPVSSEAFLDAFLPKGFEVVEPPYTELVLQRRHDKDPRYIVRIYTSVARSYEGGVSAAVRAKGQDSIKVAGVFEKGNGVTLGIVKNKRIHRVGTEADIIKRTLERARYAYAQFNLMIKKGRRA